MSTKKEQSREINTAAAKAVAIYITELAETDISNSVPVISVLERLHAATLKAIGAAVDMEIENIDTHAHIPEGERQGVKRAFVKEVTDKLLDTIMQNLRIDMKIIDAAEKRGNVVPLRAVDTEELH